LINGTQQQKGGCRGYAASEHYQPWILDTCLALWHHFKRWATGSDKPSFHDETVASYLEVLQMVAIPTKGSEDSLSGSAKSAQSLVRGLASVLEKPTLSVPNQSQLASVLVYLRSLVTEISNSTSRSGRHRVNNSSSIIVGDLEASISQLCHDTEKFSNLQKDLQVGVALRNLGHHS
jgi:serine/threonine-protein kinase ATR